MTRTAVHHPVDEVAFIGGSHTLEAQQLTEAAIAAGLRVRWLSFSGVSAQAAFAAHGPGSVRLPLVVVGGRYCLQRPQFDEIVRCVQMIGTGEENLPPGCVQVAVAE
jgi:hypothetical protein